MIEKLSLTIFIIFLFITAVSAQTPEQSILSAREESANVKIRSIELEHAKSSGKKNLFNESFRSNFPEIKEDFEKIQKLNGEIFQLTSVKTPLNYSAILKNVSDINRRAARLKENLFIHDEAGKPETNADRQNPADQTLTFLLNKLDKSVVYFSHSPIFTNANLLDAQDSLRARNELEKIIEISSAIKQQAKKMTKREN